MLQLYNFILSILAFMVNPYCKRRIRINKDNENSIAEKMARLMPKKPAGKLIWFHAVSVGETISILPLISELMQKKDVTILLTSTTLTSAKIAKEKLPKNAIYQFLPFDFKKNVQKFLNYYKADIAIFTESELWPNFITEIHKQNIPLILLNARISDKGKVKNYLYKKCFSNLLEKFSLILAQEEQDLARFRALNLNNISLIGNLKLDAPPLTHNEKELTKLRKQTKGRKLFLAVSTHQGEEKILADLHHKLRLALPNLLTIIIPRHPERKNEIINSLKESVAITIRSENETITNRTDIYLADTIGELGLFYQLCDISFIGGSLIKRGGHNPYEALRLNNITITGPNYFNFKNIFQNLITQNITILVNDEFDLEREVYQLITDKKHRDSFKENGKNFINKRKNILKETSATIISYL